MDSGRRTYPTREAELLGFTSSSQDRYSNYGYQYTLGSSYRNNHPHSTLTTTYPTDYVSDSMSRYSSRNYDSGLSSSRYSSSTPSRSYTGSSYTSGSYSSGSRSFDTGRYGNSSTSGTGRYGSSSYSSDLTSTGSSRYGSSGLGSSSTYTSSRSNIPKTDELSLRRGSRSSLSSDISLDTKDSGISDSVRRTSLRSSDKSDYLGSRRSSYKDDVLDSSNYRSSAYSSRFSDRDKSDSDTDKYRSSRRPSLRETLTVESSKDIDTSRSDYRRFSNPNNETKGEYRRYSNPNNDNLASSIHKQSSLEKTDERYSSNISPASVRKHSTTADKTSDLTSSYSYRGLLPTQEENNKQTELDGSQSPASQRLSYRTRRELERTGTESNDSDSSTKRSSRKVLEEEPTGYESFADRHRRRRESLESNNTDNEVSLDKTRWRSFASDTIKEVDKSISDNNINNTVEATSSFSKSNMETDKPISDKKVKSVDDTPSRFSKSNMETDKSISDNNNKNAVETPSSFSKSNMETDKPISDKKVKSEDDTPSRFSKSNIEVDNSISDKKVRSFDDTPSSFSKPSNGSTSELSSTVCGTGGSSIRDDVIRTASTKLTEIDAEVQITSKPEAAESKPAGTTKPEAAESKLAATTKAAEDDTVSRAERIAKYKEQRRKQLQSMGMKFESQSDSDKMDSNRANESESSKTTTKTESQTLSNRTSTRSTPKLETKDKESLIQASGKSIDSCKEAEVTKPVSKKLPDLPQSSSTKINSRKSPESNVVATDLPSKIASKVTAEPKTLPATTSESSVTQDVRNSSAKRQSPSIERVVTSNTDNVSKTGRKSPITASPKIDRASPLRSTTKTDAVPSSKASSSTKKVSSPSTLPKFEKTTSRVTASPSRAVPTVERKSPSVERVPATKSTTKAQTAGGLSSTKLGSSLNKARTPSPKARPTDPQNKQKIPETKPARVRTRLPSPSKTVKTETSQIKSVKTNQSPIVKVTTTKSAASASVRIENKKLTRSVASPKADDGVKHSRKTVSERMAKTNRKQTSGNYTSDDEDVPKRSHPPRSPATRRAKLGASSSPTGRRKLPDVTKVSKSKSKTSKSITKDSNKSPTPKTRSGKSPSPVKSPRSLKVPDSPANLDKLLKDNLDYLSDDSTIKTPSPVKKPESKRKSPTDLIVSPTQTLFKNGSSKDYVDESLLISSEYLKAKGNNSTVTSSKPGNNSDDEEFNTAPSTPQIPPKTHSEGGEKRNEDEEQDMKNGQSNQTVEEKEYGVPVIKSASTSVKLSTLHHPSPVLTHQLPIKPSHGVLTTITTPNKISTGLPPRIDDTIKQRRGNNFNQLLQKFSSSEISSSERSESDASSRYTGRSRQSNISSSDESNTDRQTPERSQSFKLRTVKENDDVPNVPKRSSSFKSDFMRKRHEVDKPPAEEFVTVLQSRSEITDNSHLTSLSKYENLDKVKPVTPPVEEIIVDKELSAVLISRRKETDEKVEKDQNSNNASTHITKPYQDAFISDSLSQSKSRLHNIDSSLAELSKLTEDLDKPESTISKTYLSDTEFGQITSQRRKSSSASLSDAVQYIKDVESSISSRISQTISKHQDEKKNSRETSPLDVAIKNINQNKTQQSSSQILLNTSQKQDVRNIRQISPDANRVASLESETVVSRSIEIVDEKPKSFIRQISPDANRVASLESKTVVPWSIEIVDEKPKSFALSDSFAIKKVTLEESSTDDLSANVFTEMLSSAQNKMADKCVSGSSITPAIIIDKQSISNSRENDAKLHDINKSKMSATVSRDNAETESRRLEEKTEIYAPKIKNEENSRQPRLINSDNFSFDEAVKIVDEVHSQFGDSAKTSSLVTSTLPSDSESVASETRYSLQKDSLPVPSEKYLDVSESTILTSSDRSRDISDNSTDDHLPRKPRTTGLSRSESLKTPGVKRTESFERRKGILKRTPSLPKQSTGPIVDEQLARILQQRKKQVETEDSQEVERPGSRRLSVTDEIAEIMKREKQNKAEQEDEEEEESSASVSERIFKMQTKIEEEKFAATPRSRSGIATPKSPFRIRSGAVTPKKQMSFEDSLPGKDDVLSSEKLFERLTTLAEDGKVETILERRRKLEESQEKHRKFQKAKREDWRRRTQPITLEEITEAHSLDSVSTLRALIRKKATTTMFDHIEPRQKLPVNVKKSEFPEHIQPPKKRRSRNERYQTTPVTAAELLCIPEHEMMESESLRSKFMCRGRQDSKADSGILSDSDFENHSATSDSLRSLTLDMDLGEDDTSRLSVSAKTSFFKQMEEKTTKDRYKGSASGAKRYIDRKKRERYLTQPITEEEVKSAAEMNDEPKQVRIPQPEVVNRTRSLDIEDDKEENDELTRLSLKDKVRLFAEKKEEEIPPPKQTTPLPRRRNRKQTSRFSTQPITIEEVEKAAKISPLLMSLVKPPDPEILKGLSLKAQRELAANHAEQTLSQTGSRNNSKPNSRAGSQPGSRRASFTEDNISSVQVSHAKSEGDLQKSPGILRKKEIRQSSPDLEIRSILKSETEKQEAEPRGILKRAETIETSKPSDDTKSILKHRDSSLSPDIDRHRGSQEVEPKSILRTIEIETREVIQSVESKNSLTENSEQSGILKKESCLEQKVSEPEKSSIISREIRSDVSPVKSILKKDDTDEERETSPPDSSTKRRSRHNERYLTQPAEVTPEKSPQSRRKYKYDARHRTQPITPDELKKAQQVTPEIMKGGSVADRLNALKKSGDEEWKKRVAPKCLDFDSPHEIKLREKKGLSEERPISLSDRLNLLDVNKTTWKNRVEESDASKFTVAGKINKTVGTVQSPLVKRLKTKREGMVIDLGSDNSPSDSPVTTPTLERIPLPKDIISHASSTSTSSTSTSSTTKTTSTEQIKTSSVTETVTTVEIPQIASNDVDSFFLQFDENPEKIDVNIDDFNDIFINSNDILTSVKKIRPVRNRPTKSSNPMKRISVEVRSEYTEVTTGIAEKELKRLKTEKISKDVGFAEEALAGLASKENFSKVALRKTDVTSSPGSKDRLDPFKDNMLLHVKGRRNVQTRLVSPTSVSINSGDCYVLVTPEKVINWVGTFSNVIEKAKAADITSFINQKRDMGCRSGTTIATIEEEKQRLGAGKHFWATLGGQQEYQAVGPEEEDEIYETLINKTNMVFKLVDNSLLPYTEYWGAVLKYDMLNPELTLVFDFGSELYLWLGKKVCPEERKVGRILSQQLWEKGYDYSSCDINPLCPLHTEDTGGVPIKSNTRPDWALFGKVHQGMETILFKEKFFDWPDSARIIKVKGQDAEAEKKVELAELQAYDVSKMVPVDTSPVTLVLEGSNVGRGTKWLEDMQGFIRQIDIITCGVDVWHVMEYDHYKLSKTSYGQFHEGDTYVVRWQYMVSNAGLKSLKGQAARNTLTGRERCAYFFWQGSESTINEKGASALMTVELDEERGPQVRVIQGKEPPCFLNLFNGSMMVHIGKREEEESNTQGPWRLYCVRNEHENELMLLEIKLCIDNLRSRSSFVLLNVKTGHLYIWNGCKSPQHSRLQARCAADKLKTHCPLEVGLHADASIMISEMEEGEEKAQFWGAVESRDRSRYMSLIDSGRSLEHSVRMFYMTSVSGIFEVTERLNPCRGEEFYTPFPFLQSDLYKVSQPALFLVDNHNDVYLWQGWWPEGNDEEGNVHTGSAHSRFNVDRKCALETTINYCKASRSRMPNMYIVCAGVEPQQFTNIFPYWEVDQTAKELNMKDGKREDYLESAEEMLSKLTRTQYTLEELQEQPLPEGVDASKLESYLDEETFESILHMSKEEFYKLPSWKQRQLKQPTGLF